MIFLFEVGVEVVLILIVLTIALYPYYIVKELLRRSLFYFGIILYTSLEIRERKIMPDVSLLDMDIFYEEEWLQKAIEAKDTHKIESLKESLRNKYLEEIREYKRNEDLDKEYENYFSLNKKRFG